MASSKPTCQFAGFIFTFCCFSVLRILIAPTFVLGAEGAVKIDCGLRYARAEDFWDEVENVLRDELDRAELDQADGTYKRLLLENLRTLREFRPVPVPTLDRHQRVRVYPRSLPTDYRHVGFLVTSDDKCWSILTNEWCQKLVSRANGGRLEDANAADEFDIVHDYAIDRLSNSDPPPAELSDALDAIEPGRRVDFLFRMAYLDHVSGNPGRAQSLLRAAFRADRTSIAGLLGRYEKQLYLSAIEDLNVGASRDEIAERFEFLINHFPGGLNAEQISSYAPLLREMAEEDAAFVTQEDISHLFTQNQVHYWTFKLRDCSAVQQVQPGHCWIPLSRVPTPSEVNSKTNPSEHLIRLGFDAVPALMASLDDRRLTRSFGFDRGFAPWRYLLRVQDAAIQTLEVIACRKFYRPSTSTSYYSREEPNARADIKQRVEFWWDDARTISEREYIRRELEKAWQHIKEKSTGVAGQPMRLLSRLSILDGRKALPDIWRWTDEKSPYKFHGDFFRLLLTVGDDREHARIQKLADPDNHEFSYGALTALHDEKRIETSEYNRALYLGSLNLCRRDEEGPAQVADWLLAKTRDPDALVLAAACWRVHRRDRSQIFATGDESTDRRILSQLMPLMSDPQASNDVFVKANELLGRPLENGDWGQFYPGSENRLKLLSECRLRGITPAASFPWEK